MKIKAQNKETTKNEEEKMKRTKMTLSEINYSPQSFGIKEVLLVPSCLLETMEWLINQKPTVLSLEPSLTRYPMFPTRLFKTMVMSRRHGIHPIKEMKKRYETWLQIMFTTEETVSDDILAPTLLTNKCIEGKVSTNFKVEITESQTLFLFLQTKSSAVEGTDLADKILKENEAYIKSCLHLRKINDTVCQTDLPIHLNKCCGGLNVVLKNKTAMATPSNLHDLNRSSLMDKSIVFDPNEERILELRTDSNQELESDVIEDYFNIPHTLDRDSELDEATEMVNILESRLFREIAALVQRTIERNTFSQSQIVMKKGITLDPLNRGFKFKYLISHLRLSRYHKSWCLPVTSININPMNENIFAVGHGQYFANQAKFLGRVNIWNNKNSSLPEKSIDFNEGVTSVAFSGQYPYALLVSFLNGVMTVLDISKPTPSVIVTNKPKFVCPIWEGYWMKKDFGDEVPIVCGSFGLVSWLNLAHQKREHLVDLSKKEGGSFRGIEIPKEQKSFSQKGDLNRLPEVYCLGLNPSDPTKYLAGTDDGCIHLCSTDCWVAHKDCFQGHLGPVYHLKFHPHTSKVFLSVGIDYCVRIWAENIYKPLITIAPSGDFVEDADWSPQNPNILATVAGCILSLWDIRRISNTLPCSTIESPSMTRFTSVKFLNGTTIITGDIYGDLHIWGLSHLPFSPICKPVSLAGSIKRILIGDDDMLDELRKLGYPFDVEV